MARQRRVELIAYTAEKERQKIKLRQREGIDIALKKGVAFGRPKNGLSPQFAEECQKWRKGEQTAVETMKKLGMKRTTFYKAVSRK